MLIKGSTEWENITIKNIYSDSPSKYMKQKWEEPQAEISRHSTTTVRDFNTPLIIMDTRRQKINKETEDLTQQTN